MPSSTGCGRARWRGTAPRPAADPARSVQEAGEIRRLPPIARMPAARPRVRRHDRCEWAETRRAHGVPHPAPHTVPPDRSADGDRHTPTHSLPPRPTRRSPPASPTTRRTGCGSNTRRSPWPAVRGPWNRRHALPRTPNRALPAAPGSPGVRWASSLHSPARNPVRLPPDKPADRSSRTTVPRPRNLPTRRPRSRRQTHNPPSTCSSNPAGAVPLLRRRHHLAAISIQRVVDDELFGQNLAIVGQSKLAKTFRDRPPPRSLRASVQIFEHLRPLHDLCQQMHGRVANLVFGDDSFKAALPLMVPQLDAGDVIGDGALAPRHLEYLLGRHKQKLRLRIDKL